MTGPDPKQSDKQLTGSLDGLIDDIGTRVEHLAMDFATESNPKLENMGLRYFAKRAKGKGPLIVEDEIHVLNPRELRDIRRAVWTAVAWAAFIGFMSGVASGVAEVLGDPWYDAESSFFDNWRYHLLVHGVTIAATLAEVWALYAVGLRAAHDVAFAAGFGVGTAADEDAEPLDRAVAVALVRAALELPNPPGNPFGVNPYRELPKWRVFLAVILYKLKITVTTFILRTLLARASTRAGVKAWLAFVSAPVTAVWDGLVMWLVLRQVRLRIIGTSAARSLISDIAGPAEALSLDVREAMAFAVASAIVRSSELHPNHAALMWLLPIEAAEIENLDGPHRLIASLDKLTESERALVMQVFGLAMIIDGRLDRRERRLWRTVGERFGTAVDEKALAALGRDLTAGRLWSRAQLANAMGVAQAIV